MSALEKASFERIKLCTVGHQTIALNLGKNSHEKFITADGLVTTKFQ